MAFLAYTGFKFDYGIVKQDNPDLPATWKINRSLDMEVEKKPGLIIDVVYKYSLTTIRVDAGKTTN